MNVFSTLSSFVEFVTEKSEYSQAFMRLTLVAILTLYYIFVSHDHFLIYTGNIYLLFSGAWLAWIRFSPDVVYRKHISLIIDMGMLTGALSIFGPEHLGLFLLIVLVIIGYGYRYGSQFIKYGGYLGFVLIYSALMFSPIWKYEANLTIEILFMFSIVISFMYRIIRNLENEIKQRTIFQNKAKRFEQKVKEDSLTKLCNREFVESWLMVKQLANARVCVMFLDLDNFKTFNDTYGHHIGDHVLINISKRLSNSVRDVDIVCRYAGDEFIILINDENVDTINDIANRIKMALNKVVEIENGERLVVTGSVGIAILGIHGHTVSEVMRNADAAMYIAKRQGRNRVAWFERKTKE